MYVCKNLSISNTYVILDLCIYFCKLLHVIIKIKSAKKRQFVQKQAKKSPYIKCVCEQRTSPLVVL